MAVPGIFLLVLGVLNAELVLCKGIGGILIAGGVVMFWTGRMLRVEGKSVDDLDAEIMRAEQAIEDAQGQLSSMLGKITSLTSQLEKNLAAVRD